MLPIGNRAYLSLGQIMSWGGAGLQGIAEEVIPTQDLTAFLLNAHIKRTQYQHSLATISGAFDTILDWSDASDWTEVQVNGVVQVADSALPQLGDERIIVGVSLILAGVNPAHYTSAELVRTMAVATGGQFEVANFGAVDTSHLCANMKAPYLLPQTLGLSEEVCNWRTVGTGTAATTSLFVQMISAERGVMRPFPGV
jgi:hypothetical protein